MTARDRVSRSPSGRLEPLRLPHGPPARPDGLLAQILPPGVVAAESVGAADAPAPALFPAEEAALRTAGPRRRAEFAAGRRCARAALARLGVPAAEILPGRAGQPQWPAGVTGSITHCSGYRACAVAPATQVAAIGIDAEPDMRLPAGLIEAIAAGPERAWIAGSAPSAPTVCWDRLLFSAKEAVFKLWYQLTGQSLGWRDAAAFPAAGGILSVRFPGPGPVAGDRRPGGPVTGRWLARGGLIVTAIVCWPAPVPKRPAKC